MLYNLYDIPYFRAGWDLGKAGSLLSFQCRCGQTVEWGQPHDCPYVWKANYGYGYKFGVDMGTKLEKITERKEGWFDASKYIPGMEDTDNPGTSVWVAVICYGDNPDDFLVDDDYYDHTDNEWIRNTVKWWSYFPKDMTMTPEEKVIRAAVELVDAPVLGTTYTELKDAVAEYKRSKK